MPPIENELAEDDFNSAVVTHLYLFERDEAERASYNGHRELAIMIATARFGGRIERLPPKGEEVVQREERRFRMPIKPLLPKEPPAPPVATNEFAAPDGAEARPAEVAPFKPTDTLPSGGKGRLLEGEVLEQVGG